MTQRGDVPPADSSVPSVEPPDFEPEIGPTTSGRLLKSDFANKVARTFATEAALSVLGLVTAIATARWLGPSGKGQLALATVVVWLLYSLSGFGIVQSIVYFTKRLPRSELVSNGLSLATALGLLSTLIGGGLAYIISPGLLDLDRSMLTVAILALPLIHLDSAARGVVQGQYELARFNTLRLVHPLVFLPLLACASAADNRVLGTIAAWTLAQFAATVLSVRAALGADAGHFEWKPQWNKWKALFLFGAQTHVGNVFKFFQYRFDLLLVGALLDTRRAGLYAVCLTLSELALRIPDAVGVVLFPKLATDDDAKQSIAPLVCRHTIFFTVGFSLLLMLATPWLIDLLFGPRFDDASGPARLLIPGGIALSLWKVVAQDMIARGKPNAYSLSALCSLLTIVVGCVVLVPRHGLAGAAIASTAAYVAAAASLFVAYRRSTGVTLADCVLMRRNDFRIYRQLLDRSWKWRKDPRSPPATRG